MKLLKTLLVTMALSLSPQSFATNYLPTTERPDTKSIADTKERKRIFFEFMFPHAVNANIDILKTKAFVSKNNSMNERMVGICDKYRVDCTSVDYKEQLLAKVDWVLPSQILAQGAIESSWGRSRFSKEANNFFGQWCFTKGCGIKPKARPDGMSYWVQSFSTTSESVRSFALNLNRHEAYSEYRELRLLTDNPSDWVDGLSAYAQNPDNITLIKDIIRQNDLREYDADFIEIVSSTKYSQILVVK